MRNRNTNSSSILTTGVCLLALSAVVCWLGTAQAQAQDRPETIQLKNHPVTFDPDLGVGIAKLGEGRLHQVEVILVEIPAGAQLPPQRHLAEEMTYIVSGQGYTMMWNQSGGHKERYEWKEGDLLSPTLNVWRQHFNASTSQPVRYLSVSTAPLTRKMFNSPEFVSSVDYSFNRRWDDSVAHAVANYIEGGAGAASVRMKVGHLLPNLRDRVLKDRGAGMLGITIRPEEGDMANNSLLEMEVREFTQPESTSPQHRHVWETVYFILKGDGYATLQKEGGPDRHINWTEGDLFLVEANEYHNHRPRGIGGRFLQIKASGYFRDLGIDPFLMQNKPEGTLGQ